MKKKLFISISIVVVVIAIMVSILIPVVPYVQEKNYQRDLVKLSQMLDGKTMSILGDSISTYEGVSNNATSANSTIGYNYCLYNEKSLDINDTWWKRTANTLGMDILVNNSFSGDYLHDDGKGIERASQLHCDVGERAGTKPDIICIYFGINDYICQFPRNFFGEKYDEMLQVVRSCYKDAKVFCLNFPTVAGYENDVSIKSYNSELKKAAIKNGCYVVDLNKKSGINKRNLSDHMVDKWLHPNKKGMTAISNCLLHKMVDVLV